MRSPISLFIRSVHRTFNNFDLSIYHDTIDLPILPMTSKLNRLKNAYHYLINLVLVCLYNYGFNNPFKAVLPLGLPQFEAYPYLYFKEFFR